MDVDTINAPGGCACKSVQYVLRAAPMFVHCCHCRWCQRETGSAFVLNAIVETNFIDVTCGAPVPVETPSESGRGQEIVRCPKCQVALWSHYSGMGKQIAFLRAGTLDATEHARPNIHIFTSSKQPWVKLGDDIPVLERYYRRSEYWPEESLARLDAARKS